MAQLKDIWEEIEKGRGFKPANWKEYFYLNSINTSVVFITQVFGHDWELEPLPKAKKKITMYQVVQKMSNGQLVMASYLYNSKEDFIKINNVLDNMVIKLIPIELEVEE